MTDGIDSKPQPKPQQKPKRPSTFERARLEYVAQNPGLRAVVPPFSKKLVSSYWARQWCLALQSFDHFGHGLSGGRTLIRKQAVFDLEIEHGELDSAARASATVWAGEPYDVSVSFAPLADKHAVAERLVSASLALSKILLGEIPREIADLLADPQRGIMPAFDELRLSCTCPDYADLCAHSGALLYGLAVRLDEDPHLLFALRGVSAGQLLDAGLASSAAVYNSEDESNPAEQEQQIEELFGLEWDDSDKVTHPSAGDAARAKQKGD